MADVHSTGVAHQTSITLSCSASQNFTGLPAALPRGVLGERVRVPEPAGEEMELDLETRVSTLSGSPRFS
jgi:hypothetical protein